MIDTYYKPEGIQIVQSVYGHKDKHGHHSMSIGLTIACPKAAKKIVEALTKRFDLK